MVDWWVVVLYGLMEGWMCGWVMMREKDIGPEMKKKKKR